MTDHIRLHLGRHPDGNFYFSEWPCCCSDMTLGSTLFCSTCVRKNEIKQGEKELIKKRLSSLLKEKELIEKQVGNLLKLGDPT